MMKQNARDVKYIAIHNNSKKYTVFTKCIYTWVNINFKFFFYSLKINLKNGPPAVLLN